MRTVIVKSKQVAPSSYLPAANFSPMGENDFYYTTTMQTWVRYFEKGVRCKIHYEKYLERDTRYSENFTYCIYKRHGQKCIKMILLKNST